MSRTYAERLEQAERLKSLGIEDADFLDDVIEVVTTVSFVSPQLVSCRDAAIRRSVDAEEV